MADQEAVTRKVRSLLALAAHGSGATKAESASAASLARRLMDLHGLTETDVPARVVERPQPAPTGFERRRERRVVVVLDPMLQAGFGSTSTTTDPFFEFNVFGP